MKKVLLLFTLSLFGNVSAQQIDTLAIQDFETIPASPTWTYTGALAGTQTGYAAAGTSIPGSPLGIDGSTAWHVVTVSSGNPIVFNNVTIPAATYDTIRLQFRLAAMDLVGSFGGPDNLDYVLVEYSLDNGSSFTGRMRIRGAVANNSFWPFDATGVASVYYTPASETVFAPTNSGLQTNEGYALCEITFPGSISQLTVRITPRSSSSSDSWLVDNVLLRGEKNCQPSASSLIASACDSYTAPSGAILMTSGNYTDVIPNATGCDSTISIDLTVNYSIIDTDVQTACGSFTWIDGNTYSTSTQTDWIGQTVNGCDSVISLDLTIVPLPDNSVTQNNATLQANAIGATYQWLDCDNSYSPVTGAVSQYFTPSATTGNYAVVVTQNGCSDTSSCYLVDFTGLETLIQAEKQVVKIYDLMGHQTEFKANTPLIFEYSDGTRERVLKLEE